MHRGPVVELAADHGLLAMNLIILDDTSKSALCVDIQQPPSHATLLAAMQRHWPRLEGPIAHLEDTLEKRPSPPPPSSPPCTPAAS